MTLPVMEDSISSELSSWHLYGDGYNMPDSEKGLTRLEKGTEYFEDVLVE